MKKIFLTLVLTVLAVSLSFPQENITFQKPSPEIMALADFKRPPSVMFDSDREYMILAYRDTYKPLSDLFQEEVRLAGIRINPITNISSTITYTTNLKVRRASDKSEKQVTGLPENPRIGYLSMSPDETKIAFTNTTQSGVEIWILDIQTAEAKKLTAADVNAALGNPFSWYADNQRLIVKMRIPDRPNLIEKGKELPAGPVVSAGDGSVSQNPTYQDLLRNRADEHNFETLATSALYTVSIDGTSQQFRPAAMYSGLSFSPDGNYLMTTTIEKPFSYVVPYFRFPSRYVVYDQQGQEIKVVNEVPLTENLPKGFDSVQKGKRQFSWRGDKPATLCYVVALDEGDKAKAAEYRDEVFTWDAPFSSEPVSLMKTKQRYGGIEWGNDRYAIATDRWYDTRNVKTYLINPSNPGQEPKLINDRNSQDIYSDPGSFETKKNQYGRYTLLLEKDNAYLIGQGYSAKGQFPFIDEMNLSTLKTKRLYQSSYTDRKEDLISIGDIRKGQVFVMIQSPVDYPNYFVRNIRGKGSLTRLTDFENPFRALDNVYKRVIKYTRKDGVELFGTLYLPAGYDTVRKEKLPLLIWAYPLEYKDKSSAGQSDLNPNEFTFPSYGSFIYWVTRGYAVLNDAAFPIVGEGTSEPNDTFVEQLVMNAEAAINAVNSMGYIDPKRVAAGGHSYGAFMTANLLSHSNLLACGIARSGAYNRSLTPFGFQNEQRNYWDAPEVYHRMSPFMNASKMKAPLLLIHGDADNNTGTYTMQTERYFQALKGLGAPVRMVLLPGEAHGYVAKENIFHVLWEQEQFLDKHLKQQR